jgi:creatinine amidohydrolase
VTIARRLADLTTDEVRALLAKPPTAALVPVGSVEPHGPHLPLATDTILSEEASARAAAALASRGIEAYVAPSIPYGVTEYAAGFAGATSVPAEMLTALLRAIATSLAADGWTHVCFVNNHLEPAHDAAVRAAIAGLPAGAASVACPLTKRWARTLSDEFKRGDCHAGRYETSLAFAAGAAVRDGYRALATLTTSLATEIKAGKTRFLEMGLDRAYTGAPSEATREEGDALFAKLVDMIVTEITEAIGPISTDYRDVTES